MLLNYCLVALSRLWKNLGKNLKETPEILAETQEISTKKTPTENSEF